PPYHRVPILGTTGSQCTDYPGSGALLRYAVGDHRGSVIGELISGKYHLTLERPRRSLVDRQQGRGQTPNLLGSALLGSDPEFRQEPVELIRKPLAVGIVERRRPAGALPRAAQLVQVIAQRQALLDVLR